MSKPRVIKDYDMLSDEIISQIKITYPKGFERKLITFKNKDGKLVNALPFETDDFYYLIRMTRKEAQEIIEEDNDYDENGNLTEKAQERIDEELQVEIDTEEE